MKNKPTKAAVAMVTRMAELQRQINLRRRDHQARNKDGQRERLAADVAAFLARGGKIAQSRPMTTAPGLAPVRVAPRSW